MASLSFAPIAHTVFTSAFSSLVGCHVGHAYGFINREKGQQPSRLALCTHLAGYALTAIASYGAARALSPAASSDYWTAITYQSAAIAITSLIATFPFASKQTLPYSIATAVAVPPIASILVPRPLASVASSLTLLAVQFFTPAKKQASPDILTEKSSLSNRVIMDIIAIALITTVASVEGIMSQSHGK